MGPFASYMTVLGVRLRLTVGSAGGAYMLETQARSPALLGAISGYM
jgi:hypothetical protein